MKFKASVIALFLFTIHATANSFVPPKKHEIKVTPNGFEPQILFIRVEDEVVWSGLHQGHSIQTYKGTRMQGLPLVTSRKGRSLHLVMNKASIIPYICPEHGLEHKAGIIVVGEIESLQTELNLLYIKSRKWQEHPEIKQQLSKLVAKYRPQKDSWF